MKRLLFFLLVSIYCSNSNAQTPAWLWARNIGGIGYELYANAGHACVADRYGNLYVTGMFDSPVLTQGNTTLTNNGSGDVFVSKYDPFGNLVWTRKFGGAYTDYGRAITLDTNGQIYITGYFSISIQFDGYNLTASSPVNNLFIAKLDTAGNTLWAATATGNLTGDELATDANGNLYVAGHFIDTATFGSSTIIAAKTPLGGSLFVAKFSPTGNPLWAYTPVDTSATLLGGITTDASGNVWLAGNFSGTSVSFGNTTLFNTGAWNSTDLFVAHISSAGTALSAFTFGNSADQEAINDLALDANGNLVVAGSFWGNSIQIGNTTLSNTNPLKTDAFLAKFSTAGMPAWAVPVNGQGHDYGSYLAINANNDIYLAGIFNSPTLSFGTTSLSLVGASDVYIARYNSSGSPASVMSVTGTSASNGLYVGAIALDPNGNIFLIGEYGTAVAIGSYTLTSLGTLDDFVAKYGYACLSAPAQPSNITGNTLACAGNTLTYSIAPVPYATGYAWTLPTGWTGNSSAANITVTAGNTGGNISVAAINTCGTSAPQIKAVTSSPQPNPVITKSGNTLSTAAGQGTYQWYRYGNIIGGATNNTYLATLAGNYYVEVTNSGGCMGQSNTISLTVGIHEIEDEQLLLYPQPNDGRFTIELPDGKTPNSIRVMDMKGAVVNAEALMSNNQVNVRLTGATPSIYCLILSYINGTRTMRFEVQ